MRILLLVLIMQCGMCWAGLPTQCPAKHKSLHEIPVIFSLEMRYQVISNGYTYVKITQSEREALVKKAKNKEAYVWQGGFTRFSGGGAPETILICTNCGYAYDDISGEWLKISDKPVDFAVPLLDPVKQIEVVMKDSSKTDVKYIQSFFEEYRHDKMEYEADRPSAEVVSYFKKKIPLLGVSEIRSPARAVWGAEVFWIIGKWKQYYMEVRVTASSSVRIELSSENGMYNLIGSDEAKKAEIDAEIQRDAKKALTYTDHGRTNRFSEPAGVTH